MGGQREAMKAQDYRKGMQTPWYTVAEDAQIIENGHGVRLIVQYPDGGFDARTFDYGHNIPTKEEAARDLTP
jgi:hypothetical protein